MILTHNNNYDGLIFHANISEQNVIGGAEGTTIGDSPVLMYSESNPRNRLGPEIISTRVTKGNQFVIPNMKGRSLKDVGFEDSLVKLGQRVDVGLRTTDLAVKLTGQAGSSISSTKIDKKRHSSNFLSYSFNDVDVLSALRFVSKHDGKGIRADRFGNINYTQQNKINKEHSLSTGMVTGGIETNNIHHSPNRVTVYGKKWANNIDNVVKVDDTGRQTNGVVNEVSGGIHVPTASNTSSARRIGQRLLATANRAKNTKTLKGIVKGTKISPGDQVRFRDDNIEEQIVLQTKHNLTEKTTDVVLSSVLTGVDDILQKFQEDNITNNFDTGISKTGQITTINLTANAIINISSQHQTTIRSTGSKGLIIGAGARGKIHGNPNQPDNLTKQVSRTGIAHSKYKIRR